MILMIYLLRQNCVIANENDFNRVITVLEEDMI